MTDTQHTPRAAARAIMRDSLPAEQWARNEAFTERLKATITGHRLYTHPILAAWERNEFTLESLRFVHLEVRAGFLELFMESLLRLMQTTTQLERDLGPKAKVAARFLIQLNVLDELGFVPGGSEAEGFQGSPDQAHYWQLMEALVALGAPPETWWDSPMSPEAQASHAILAENQDDHLRLASVLATIETVFMPFYDPWARNTVHVCGDVAARSAYHTIHVENDDGHFVDDEHSEDSWYVVRQALTDERRDEVETLIGEALDTWAALMDLFMRHNRELRQAA